MGDWSELLHDLLVEVARRTDSVEDFMAFRGVCTTWRAAASKDKFVKWPGVPLLMMAEEEESDDREFYSLRKGKICMRLSLPEAKGKRCLDVKFGWLLTIGGSGELNLLNPLTGSQIVLPSQATFTPYGETEQNLVDFQVSNVTRAVLSASPSDPASDFVLMVAWGDGFFLSFWRHGDQSWTTSESMAAICDVNFYQGKFYAIGYGGVVWVWDVLEFTEAQPKSITDVFVDLLRIQFYLVESRGELLIVARNNTTGDGYGGYGVTIFSVLQLDVLQRQYKEIRSLENNAIFVGNNAAFSIDTTNWLRGGQGISIDTTNWLRGGQGIIKANSIYFTDDCVEGYGECEVGGGKEMGVYQLKDGSIQRFNGLNSYSFVCPPLWVSPSY